MTIKPTPRDDDTSEPPGAAQAAPYVIVPFVRGDAADRAELAVRLASTGAPATRIELTVVRPNGQVAARGALPLEGADGDGRLWSRPLFADLFGVCEAGAAHVEASDDTDLLVELWVERGGRRTGHAFGGVDYLAGTGWSLAHTDATVGHAALANAGGTELFVFVNDKQGPFVPPGGAARIAVPEPGGPLRVIVESGDAVLAYAGRAIPADE